MQVQVLTHSSIRITDDSHVIYADPYDIREAINDADYIFVTHSHYDHYSVEDINKKINNDTVIIAPKSMEEQVLQDYPNNKHCFILPKESINIGDIQITATCAYNVNKAFHPRGNNWVGYLITIGNETVYIAGDTDFNDDLKDIKCDIALIPVGGTYTCDYKSAAELVNNIKPKVAIPTHYGSVVGKEEDARKFCELVDSGIKTEKIMQY